MIFYPSEVNIYEVGPRDGLQNEPAQVPTAVKREFISHLARAGFRIIEATSFVHPRWIPQLSDAEELLAGLPLHRGTRYSALVPNLRGLQRARTVGLESVAVFISASETHNRKNLNRSIDESLAQLAEVMAEARSDGCWIRAYVSMCFGCPFEGEIAHGQVARVATRLLELGADELSLGDTVGFGTPRSVSSLLGSLAPDVPMDQVALHLHDTRGTALANVVAGLDAGVRTFDGATGGLGGCPYAAGATGNVATEDLVQMLDSMGVHTGLDLDAILDAAWLIEQELGRPLPSRNLRLSRGQAVFHPRSKQP